MSAYSYAWHNEWPQKFLICNEVGEKVTIKIENRRNLKVSISGGAGPDTKWDFDVEPGKCGFIEPATAGNVTENSKFRLAVFKYGKNNASYSIDIKNHTEWEEERYASRVSDGSSETPAKNNHNSWSVKYPGVTNDDWNVLAVIDTVIYYPKNGSKTGSLSHTKGVVDLTELSNLATSNELLINAPGTEQTLYIVGNSNSTIAGSPSTVNTKVGEILAHEVYENFNRLTDKEKEKAIRLVNGTSAVVEGKPIKLCKISGTSYTVDKDSQALITSRERVEADAVMSSNAVLQNNSSTLQNITTSEFMVSDKQIASTTVTKAWEVGVEATVAVKLSVPTAEKSAQLSINYQYSKSEEKTIANETIYEKKLTAQTLAVPAFTELTYRGDLLRARDSGKFEFYYNLKEVRVRANITTDNDCYKQRTNIFIDAVAVLSSPNAKLDNGIKAEPGTKTIKLIGTGTFIGEGGYKEFYEITQTKEFK